MTNEDYIVQLGMLEQEAEKLEQQAQVIEQHSLELENIKNSLEEIEKTHEKEMLANLGKNIFIKTQILDKTLMVDVGNKTFVKKTISETVKIVEQELKKLKETRVKIISKMGEIQKDMQSVIDKAEKSN